MRSGPDSRKENAAGCIRNLSIPQPNRQKIVDAGGVPLLVELIANGTDGQKEQSAAAIRGIAVEQAYKSLIGQGANAIRPLIALARNGNAGQKEQGKAALINLASGSDGNKRLITAEGYTV